MHKKLISLFVLTPLLAGLLQAQVIPTKTTALEAYDMPGYFLVCRNTTQSVRLVQGGDLTPEGQWNIVTGLTGTGTVSFTPAVALVNHYMRHRSYVLYADPAATDDLFRGDASFTPRPGLADPTCVSFESQNYPGRFLIHGAAAATIGFRIDPIATDAERARATFKFVMEVPGLATDPVPEDEASDVIRETALSWTAGEYAVTHDVYFGTNFTDVNTATRANPLGVLVSREQTAATFTPPQRLEFSTTYYWRIDEVNAPSAGGTIYKGNVWSFVTEPYSYEVTEVTATASSSNQANTGPEKTVDGSGLNADGEHGTTVEDGWVSAKGDPQWIQYELPQVCKLDKMLVWNSNQGMEALFGFGVKDVTIECSLDGAAWSTLGTFEFAQATGSADYKANTTVDFAGAAAKFVKLTIGSNWGGIFQQYGLSEVRFYSIPVVAREPSPAPGATNVHPQVALSWRAGREASSHTVYVATDQNAVTDGAVAPGTTAQPVYNFVANLEETYYWKVVEVNEAENPTSWASSVWSFSTAAYIAVDDFESYTNDSPNRVFQTWIDGAGFSADEFFPNGNAGNGSGSLVGNDPAAGNIMETNIFHGGQQSMPFYYDNASSAAVSEAVRTFDEAQDWTKSSVKTLVLYFYGDPNNAANQLYVKINSTKVPYGGPADNIQRARWNQWTVDLSTVPASTLQSVKTLTIGVGNAGAGMLLIDDIRLYRSAPQIPVAVDPGTTGLVAHYAFNNNVTDGSGSGNNGTLVGAPTYAAGLAGMAMQFYGTADAVDLGAKAAFNPTGSLSVSLWANIGAWSTAWANVMIGNRGEDNIGWQLRRYSSSRFCFTTRGVGNDDMSSTVTPPLGEWIHFTCVYDNVANTKTIYINGVQDRVVTTTAGATIAATTHKTYIGARALGDNSGPEAYFTGLLDEIRVYNRALSAGEADFLSDPTP